MNFEKARISLNSFYDHIMNDTADLRKLIKMPKAALYRNLKRITQQDTIKGEHGNGRPRTLNQNDEKSVGKKSQQLLEINFGNNPRGSNIKKR